MSARLVVDFVGERHEPATDETFTIGRGGDLVLDADNPFLHRHFLTITHAR